MNSPLHIRRRRFVAGTAAAGALTILQPWQVFGTAANSKLKLGLIGCGGRGSWIADLFAASNHYQLTACSDYFQDRVDAVGSKFNIPANRRYTGLSGHKRLLESEVEVVAIETPPYFHPAQARDAVEAGKHVYLAKPIAVDAPGCLEIAEAGKKATEKKLGFLVDFQTRANEHFRNAIDQVHQGSIGSFVLAEAFYPWSGGGRGEPPQTAEEQLRNWYYVLPLSGDFIVEQSIHSLDVATWILNADPVRARAAGGHKVRPRNSIYDHFVVTYEFPKDLLLSFTCVQSIPMIKDEIRARVYGSEGFIDVDYFGSVYMRGKDSVVRQNVDNLYTTGTQVNIQEFYQTIRKGDFSNPTVLPSVRSNLTAVLGREAAYKKAEITLQELLKNGKRLEPNLKGLKT